MSLPDRQKILRARPAALTARSTTIPQRDPAEQARVREALGGTGRQEDVLESLLAAGSDVDPSRANGHLHAVPLPAQDGPPAGRGGPFPLRGLAHAAPPIQAKLAIQQPGDPHEQEADRMADHLTRPPDGSAVPFDERQHPRQLGPPHVTPTAVPALVHEVLRSPGQPLDPAARAFAEPHFGFDFSPVRVHAGSTAQRSATALNAKAYTMGYDIVFAAGQFAPNTHQGRRLIAHELTHVVQQSRSGQVYIAREPIDATTDEATEGGKKIDEIDEELEWARRQKKERDAADARQDWIAYDVPVDENLLKEVDPGRALAVRFLQFAFAKEQIDLGPSDAREIIGRIGWMTFGDATTLKRAIEAALPEGTIHYSSQKIPLAIVTYQQLKDDRIRHWAWVEKQLHSGPDLGMLYLRDTGLAYLRGGTRIINAALDMPLADLIQGLRGEEPVDWVRIPLPGEYASSWGRHYGKFAELGVVAGVCIVAPAALSAGTPGTVFSEGGEVLGSEVLGSEVLGSEVLGSEVLGSEVLAEGAATGSRLGRWALNAGRHVYLNAPTLYGDAMLYSGASMTTIALAQHVQQIRSDGLHLSDIPQFAEDLSYFFGGYEVRASVQAATARESPATSSAGTDPVAGPSVRSAAGAPYAGIPTPGAKSLFRLPFLGPFLRKGSLVAGLKMRAVDDAFEIPRGAPAFVEPADTSVAVTRSAPARPINLADAPDLAVEASPGTVTPKPAAAAAQTNAATSSAVSPAASDEIPAPATPASTPTSAVAGRTTSSALITVTRPATAVTITEPFASEVLEGARVILDRRDRNELSNRGADSKLREAAGEYRARKWAINEYVPKRYPGIGRVQPTEISVPIRGKKGPAILDLVFEVEGDRFFVLEVKFNKSRLAQGRRKQFSPSWFMDRLDELHRKNPVLAAKLWLAWRDDRIDAAVFVAPEDADTPLRAKDVKSHTSQWRQYMRRLVKQGKDSPPGRPRRKRR